MAKIKFSLTATPTFKSAVAIPVPGAQPTKIDFTFKARTKDQFKEFIEKLADREDVPVIMDIASGWELEDAFTKENVELLNQNYLGAARAIIETYINQQTAGRLGN